MRRAWRRSARILARVFLPTRSGPSMTMNLGDCGPRSGCGARLAAVDSLAAIFARPRRGRSRWADYSRVARTANAEKRAFWLGCKETEEKWERGSRTPNAIEVAVVRCHKCENMFTLEASTGVPKRANGGAREGYQ